MRIILIDNNSGFIFGDTADFAAGVQIDSIQQAAELLDASLNVTDRVYSVIGRNPNSDCTGYDCYRADIDGSDVVPVVHDGQDSQTIAGVIENCEYVGFVIAATIS